MKNRTIRAALSGIVIALLLAGLVPSASAQSPVRKLGRGLANTATGFLEIPQKVL